MSTDLAIIPSKENALIVFTSDKGLDPYLEKIKEEIDAFSLIALDVSKESDRKKIASMSYKIARSKTALDDAGKTLTDQLKEMPRKVDAERKRMRDLLDSWKDEIREPLTKWESEEEDRKEAIRNRIENMEYSAGFIFGSSQGIEMHLQNLKNIIIDESFQEFQDKALAQKNASIVFLQDKLEKLLSFEAAEEEIKQIAENARIESERRAEIERVEREKRIAEEATIKAEQAAAEKAREEKEVSERRELELKLEAETAKRRALEAEERAAQAKVEAEEKAKQDQEAKTKLDEEERRQREEDKKHRVKIRQDIIKDFMAQGFTLEEAQEICAHLEAGIISHVEIIY